MKVLQWQKSNFLEKMLVYILYILSLLASWCETNTYPQFLIPTVVASEFQTQL